MQTVISEILLPDECSATGAHAILTTTNIYKEGNLN
jgi:hypothetical protein